MMGETLKPAKFEYIKLPALRFIGIDAWRTNRGWADLWRGKNEFLPQLEAMKESLDSTIPYACAFCHHDNGEVDKVNRYLVGRFFKADTPVPDGYDYCDLKPQTAGYAVFEEAIWEQDFFVRYTITRDKILNDGITIPYPVGYWHAEVYFDKTPVESPLNCGVLFATNKDKTT